MNTSIKTRAAALVAAILVTFGTIDLIAGYAYPTAPAIQVALHGPLRPLGCREFQRLSLENEHEKQPPFTSRGHWLRPTLILGALAVDAAMAQDVALDATCAPLLTHQQRRLYEKANAGIDVLRQFVFIRRAILQVDVYETATWAGSLNVARANCSSGVSDAAEVRAATL